MSRILLIFVIILLVIGAPISSHAEQKKIVVILQGIFRTHKHMQPLADYLEKQGHEVLNLDYPSTDYPIDKLIEQTANFLTYCRNYFCNNLLEANTH